MSSTKKKVVYDLCSIYRFCCNRNFIININNTKSKEDANKQYFSESIKSYENFNPTYIKYGLDSEYIFAIDEHAKMLLYHRVNTEPVFFKI